MKKSHRNLVSIILGLTAIGYTIFLYFTSPEISIPTGHWLLFVFLITITTYISIPIGIGEVSLMPMVSLSSILVIGIIPTVIAEIFSDLIYGLARGLLPGHGKWDSGEDGYSLAATTTANITMHVSSLLAAGTAYFGLGGHTSVRDSNDIFIVVGTAAVYIVTNYLIAGFFLLIRSRAHFKSLLVHFRKMLVYEAIPIAFAPLLALVFTKLGILAFSMLALSLILIANLLKDQAKTHQDLERRIQELSGLQAVGQSLSSSLDIIYISEAIYREVSKLMPANNFYVALWNPETDEVSFPVIYENNTRVKSQVRTSKRGITEYVIKTKKPLLIEKNVKKTCELLGLEHFGEEALSWLGVPILAGDVAIGMIAVQSYLIPNQIPKTYDRHNQEILNTIASQASVAIQNAWLYTQTDEALAKRVQELNSILNTTLDGMLLLNNDLRVIEINRALCNLLDINPGSILLKSFSDEGKNPLFSNLIENETLELLSQNSQVIEQKTTIFHGMKETHTERTITPVRDKLGNIIGWLCVFRDLTEQKYLENLKEDLTRMLVHDLRSPIVNMQGGLDMIEVLIEDNDKKTMLEMIEISRKASTRMLEMINELLEITKLEADEIVLHLGKYPLKSILSEEIERFLPVLKQENIDIQLKINAPQPEIELDRELFGRVTHNIIDNAIKYSPDGSKIEVSAQPDPSHLGYMLLEIRDQGSGIKPEEIRLLFKKFFSSQQTFSRRRGTGLGLYFCKLAVGAHHGQIWVESEIGKGSTFFIRLPFTQPVPQ